LHRDLAYLTFYPVRKKSQENDKAVDRMVASIREFGFKVPMLARSTGEVVDGHLRLKPALKLGLAELPVILCDEWTEAQVKAFRPTTGVPSNSGSPLRCRPSINPSPLECAAAQEP
jgi:hypothetical protein